MDVRFLSDQELDLNLKRLVVSERKILNLVLQHILEVENRKMFLEKAYSSMYEYLIKELGYSGSSAMRRLSAARLLKEVPEVGEKIKDGDINLSQITELSRAIKEKEKTGSKVSTLQKQDLVTAISGKSTAESQKQIARELDIDLKPPEKTFVQKDDSVHLQLTLSKEQYEKILKCRDFASNKLLSECTVFSQMGRKLQV